MVGLCVWVQTYYRLLKVHDQHQGDKRDPYLAHQSSPTLLYFTFTVADRSSSLIAAYVSITSNRVGLTS